MSSKQASTESEPDFGRPEGNKAEYHLHKCGMKLYETQM